MPRFRLKLTAVLAFAPVMVVAAIAWGAPAMADFPPLRRSPLLLMFHSR
jgi:hypothetical protein